MPTLWFDKIFIASRWLLLYSPAYKTSLYLDTIWNHLLTVDIIWGSSEPLLVIVNVPSTLPVPSKLWPQIVLGVWSLVAEAALPALAA